MPVRTRAAAAVVSVVALLAAGAVFAGLATHEAPGPREARGPTVLRVVTWNVCGEAGGKRGEAGYCPYRNSPAEKVEQITELAHERDADVIALQEICGGAAGSHLSLLRTALGPEWSVRRAEGARPDGRTRCRGGLSGHLGVAIAVRGKVVGARSRNVLPPDPAGHSHETLPVLCVRVSGWSYTPCTTHILPGEEPRVLEQITGVRDFVRQEDRPTVLTGDFNRNSGAAQLKPLASAFTECPGLLGTGQGTSTYHQWMPAEGTHSFHTLDHVFVSKASEVRAPFARCGVDRDRMDTTPNVAGGVEPDGYSDHAPVFADIRTGG
ncbi:Metal-dependent hydrolase, endonuclease/exonuclease/phosphatase family [Streptomyces sp. BpilaLS-43]|uniref:endonuclease/exonuclease/phosphatase family protein n=1 Tax=Streptomyces sp. BpilaLS-43 TaxID=1839778 RepID=UPI00081BB351|nr:endonuclease/exonuclease/phosphatase family protein [Streptomyces sp. BpilaLS-43]SCD74463.1 Metal-dependent hydrolase, endonuclease/exonuclease/phosphatase family [Streptomyces sp. BpilaLS-43]